MIALDSQRRELGRLVRHLAVLPAMLIAALLAVLVWEIVHGDSGDRPVFAVVAVALLSGAALSVFAVRQMRRVTLVYELALLEARERAEQLAEERRQVERRRAAQLAAARVLADAESLRVARAELLAAVSVELGFEAARVWTPEAGELRVAEAWLSDPAAEGELPQGWRELRRRPDEGLPGQVFRSGAAAAAPPGSVEAPWQEALAFPVPAGKETAAVVELLSRRGPLLPGLVEAAQDIGIQIGAFVERRRSRRALADAERRRAAELERAVADRTRDLLHLNRELEAFSYSVSHDLRAPVRALAGFAQALEEEYASRLDGPGLDYLARMRAASRRMSMLIDDLLQLSRVSRAELRRQDLDLSALVREVVAEVQDREPGRRVAWRIQAGVQARADPRLLRVALVNLVENAMKFTRPAAEPRIEFEAQDGPEGRSYLVRDNGAGFDMAYAGRLFQPFQRLHTAEEFEGTGVGLATLQRIVHRHGGRVWAEGQPGRGATFYFTLGEGRPEEGPGR